MYAIGNLVVQNLFNSDRIIDKHLFCTSVDTFSTLEQESWGLLESMARDYSFSLAAAYWFVSA